MLNLAEALDASGLPDGPLAVISAGWQEAEADIDDVREVTGRTLEDLRPYQRANDVFKADERLADAYRVRQDRLKEQQQLYRQRLKQLALAALQTLNADGDAEIVAAEQRHAIAQLRALDRHHLHRTESIHAEFDASFNSSSHSLLADQAREMNEIIDRSAGVLITGGNIVVLLNRMRLFDLEASLADTHVAAWSAGAMVLAERIVLFHDRMPLGRRNPEILGGGLGLAPGYVFLADVERRLRQRDRLHVGLMSRRFSPDVCVALDSGSQLLLEGERVDRAEATRRLSHDGRLTKLGAAA
ncbi:MAG: Type 1 glutamine amidotransferase-like domain-containing protein [Woeseiaceae bacterium]|nr:Type 1 glutamine amidotransferase-like domain-containing protein [Woeseiaceae bacterium]